jgi:glycerol-3-phosphate O-acyltransferase
MLTLRHLVIETDDTYRANPNERVLLQYYANAIVHLFKGNETDNGGGDVAAQWTERVAPP